MVGHALKRALDLTLAVPLLVLLAPVILAVAAVIKLESRGPVFHRCKRVGRGGRELWMIKFRKMHDGAGGPALAAAHDERFTRLGPFLASTKLDELPQLWNVVKGHMSLVGPRPEDPNFVETYGDEYEEILDVLPGMTGLSQLAFARESEILDPEDRVGHYVKGILPQKIGIDCMYAARRSLRMDLGILWWTAAAVLLRREVAVHRETGGLTLRTPRKAFQPVALEKQRA
jgi:lipopolysaccharide/colanic/teichoic acid biosynthesis glycosyltransferase